MSKYTIYAVDRAGNRWDLTSKDNAEDALDMVRLERWRRGPNMVNGTAGVYLTDDPEAGDQESKLMEECE